MPPTTTNDSSTLQVFRGTPFLILQIIDLKQIPRPNYDPLLLLDAFFFLKLIIIFIYQHIRCSQQNVPGAEADQRFGFKSKAARKLPPATPISYLRVSPITYLPPLEEARGRSAGAGGARELTPRGHSLRRDSACALHDARLRHLLLNWVGHTGQQQAATPTSQAENFRGSQG